MLNAASLLNEIGLVYSNKNQHRGWLEIKCPMCDDAGMRGGINIKYGAYHCFRCGPHWIVKALHKASGKSLRTIQESIKRNSSGSIKSTYSHTPAEKVILPENIALGDIHKRYLEERGFSPEDLVFNWDIRATTHIGSYKFRILIPIYLDGILISYQARDISKNSKLRYMACKKEDEVFPHQSSLYGIDKAKGKKAIVCEGVTDVWKLGPGAVAVFGTSYTHGQVRLLVERFDTIHILFDPESNATALANRLANDINILGKKASVWSLDYDCDPGDLTYEQAKEVKDFIMSS